MPEIIKVREGWLCRCNRLFVVPEGPTSESPTHCEDCGERLRINLGRGETIRLAQVHGYRLAG